MCTLEKRGDIFILTITGDDDHRLNPTLISSIRSSLSNVKSQCTVPGSAIITIAEGKYFSNGFDLNWAKTASSDDSPSKSIDHLLHMVNLFKQLVADLVSFPMPTIAAITGHAAAAGLILAMSHDYVLMRRDRGILYMPEIDIGMTLPDYFIAMMRSKVGKPEARRDLLLRGVKVKADEAKTMGLVDSVHESVVEAAVCIGAELANRKWDGQVYAEIRKSLHPELCNVLNLTSKDYICCKATVE
uniref:enoyl-CoA delta isomerase 2, peroxisomal-like n=1 Tax=Erigeron canadensis TaxID=72917 RepID=UPI001CB9963C|nr:enoyl-CoA delta isomerase 2, peroxisomal-like [Erigeron canadensis]